MLAEDKEKQMIRRTFMNTLKFKKNSYYTNCIHLFFHILQHNANTRIGRLAKRFRVFIFRKAATLKLLLSNNHLLDVDRC